MSTGDSNDMLARLKSLVPGGWFAFTAPIRDVVFGGLADSLSNIYVLIVAARAQTRASTSSGWFLDLRAWDFFGTRFMRKVSEPDESFGPSIGAEVTRERVTRKGIVQAIEDLTKTPASIFEPGNPYDTGGFGAQWALNEPRSAIGSDNYPNTIFVSAVEPVGAGIPNLAGLNDPQAGLGPSYFGFADKSLVSGSVTDQDIYDTVNANRAAGITAWVNIGPAPIAGGRLDFDFYLDETPLA